MSIGVPNAEIWQTIDECPSGALTCVYNHGIKIEFDETGSQSALLLTTVNAVFLIKSIS